MEHQPPVAGDGRPSPGPAEASTWRELDRRRGRYYSLFFGVILANLLYSASHLLQWNATPFLVADLALGDRVLALFLGTAARCGLSNIVLVLIAVGILLPTGLIPVIVVVVADHAIGNRIARGWREADPSGFAAVVGQARVTPLAYWPVILALIPFIGPVVALPLSLLALRAIGRSEGRLKGRGWAWAGVALSAAGLAFAIVVLSGAVGAHGK